MPDSLDDHPLRRRGSRPQTTRWDIGRLVSQVAVAVGAALLLIGYWGTSGTTDPSEQIPYLASSTFPGLALVIGGLVLLSRREQQRQRAQTEVLVERFDAVLAWLASADDDGSKEADRDGSRGSERPVER